MCHVCGRHDPRLALLMLDARRERRACQHSRLGRWRAPFWHVIHHRFHLTAAAVSLSLSQTTGLAGDTWEAGQISLWDRWRAEKRNENPSVIFTAVTSQSIQTIPCRAAATSWLFT